MKKFVLGFIVGALLFTALPIGAAIEEYICYKADYKVMVNGVEYISEDLPILNYKGYTYAPFRSILEAAGLNVNWNAELRQAEVTLPEVKEDVSMNESVPLNKYGLPDFRNVAEKDRPAIETDGSVKYFTHNDIKYVKVSNRIVPESSLYFFRPLPDTLENGELYYVVQLLKGSRDGTGPVIVIEEIPYALHSDIDNHYVPYDYYLNTLLPLITKGAE